MSLVVSQDHTLGSHPIDNLGNPDLERSTQMFGQLADPNGANNPLSQVLYGLALRYDNPAIYCDQD